MEPPGVNLLIALTISSLFSPLVGSNRTWPLFVIDVSGSMDRENRLELLKRSLFLLLDELSWCDGLVSKATQQ